MFNNGKDFVLVKQFEHAPALLHVTQEIQIIGQYEPRKQLAKQMMGGLQQMAQAIKQLAEQTQQMSQQAQPGIDPETQAKIQERMLLAQTNAEISKQKAAQKQQEKDIAYLSENQRRNAMTQADIQRGHAKTASEILAEQIKARNQPEPANAE